MKMNPNILVTHNYIAHTGDSCHQTCVNVLLVDEINTLPTDHLRSHHMQTEYFDQTNIHVLLSNENDASHSGYL